MNCFHTTSIKLYCYQIYRVQFIYINLDFVDGIIEGILKAGLAHVQFETIHPFLDGNGRLGRLLVTLLLCANGLLDEPVLYLSLYLKANRDTYYNLLQEVREHGTWETWLEFFLIGVYQSSKQAVQTIQKIHDLFEKDLEKISHLGRARFSCEQTFEYMKRLPQVTVPLLAKELQITPPTARSALNHLASIAVLEETSGKKRDKVYVYRKYLDILEEGAKPFFNSSPIIPINVK